MRAKDIYISPLAERDLEEIWLYTFDTWSLTQADIYIEEMYDAFKVLAHESDRGQPI